MRFSPAPRRRPTVFFSARSFARIFALAGMLALLPLAEASAQETRVITDNAGKPMFELLFFDKGERYDDPEGPDAPNVSTWQMDAAMKNAVTEAARLWAEILGPGAVNSSPAVIHVGTYDTENADAVSEGNPDWEGPPWESFSGLSGALIGDQRMGPPARIRLGKLSWDIADTPSPLPTGRGAGFVSVLYHEMGHALGILSGSTPIDDGLYAFNLTEWDKHLYDAYGTQAQHEMLIYMSGDPDATPGTDFIVGQYTKSGVTFRGEYVDEVLNGAMIGLPIEGYESDGEGGWAPELSHIELERALMSHQNYRNYSTYMEAELAALQDIGHTIDRRNFYGFSVYNDGLTLVNDLGYYARNAERTGWVPGQANTASFGVGLHIYGKGNDITQTADLLAGGMAGTGVRVDGSANTLRIAPGTRVFADGDYGTALLTAYGKDQIVISRGDVRAAGTGGVGALFDFGGNVLGDDTEYRGSWIWNIGGIDTPLNALPGGLDTQGFPLNLDGPLVERFDVSGLLEGSAAALLIGETAYVRNINIIQGATLRGDIISKWDPQNAHIQYATLTGHSNTELVTSLTFGLQADAAGEATGASDSAFRLRYDGNILGADSIRMAAAGGSLSFNGLADVLDVEVRPGATLSGNARYILNEISDGAVSVGGTFTNNGTLAPGNSIGSIIIEGDYKQTSTGLLALEFDASGQTDKLEVTKNADLAGTLSVAPVRDYYGAPVSFALSDMVTAGGSLTSTLGTTALTQPNSPTLTMTLASSGSGNATTYTLTSTRAADAYSRHAANGEQRELARVFDGLGRTGAIGDARNLMAALDFSAPDGGTLRDAYNQLGPGLYNHAAEASLSAQRLLNAAMPSASGVSAEPWGIFAGCPKAPSDQPGLSSDDGFPGWSLFLTPLGGFRHRKDAVTSSQAGVLAGLETKRMTEAGILTLGGHTAFLYRRDTLRGGGSGRMNTTGFFAGGQGRLAFAGMPGTYVFGLFRLGLESSDLRRSIDFNGYDRRAETDWLAPSGSLLAGGGWDFQPADGVDFGPTAWLDYSAVRRPALTERDAGAASLRLDAQFAQSLRSSLGLRLNAALPSTRGSLAVSLTTVWNHEMLSRYGRARARFANYGDSGFARTASVRDRDTASVTLNVTGYFSDTFQATLSGGGETGRRTKEAWGGLQLQWKF